MPSFKCLLNGDFFFVRSRVKTVGNDHPFIKARFFERFFDPLQVISEFSPLRKVNPVASTSMSVNCAIRDTIGM